MIPTQRSHTGQASEMPAMPPDAAAYPLARVRQLRSRYDPATALDFPLDLGDYLSLLYRLDEQEQLIAAHGPQDPLPLKRSWYAACCAALGRALTLAGTPLDTLDGERAYDPREMVRGFREALRERHGTFQAIYHEIALGGLLRQRADILRMGRSVTHVSGGPGSGIADDALRARLQKVYFTDFDEALLLFSRQLLEIDALLVEMLPIQAGPPVDVERLHHEFGYPDPADPQWTEAFSP